MVSQAKLNYPFVLLSVISTRFSKLELTRNIFNEIHIKEQERLKSLWLQCELSEKYYLADVVAHLTVPTWFDWTEKHLFIYLFKKINSMSIDEFLQGKVIKVNPTSETDASREFIDLSNDAASIRKETMFCKDTVVSAEIDGALTLLNLPAAIQQQPMLDPL